MAFCVVLGETMRNKKIQRHKLLQMTAINYRDIILGISLEFNYGQFQESSTHRENKGDTSGLWSEQQGALASSHICTDFPQICMRKLHLMLQTDLAFSKKEVRAFHQSSSFHTIFRLFS